MKLRHLRTFVTVAEQGTVAGAALRLRIAQPALSRQISDLESELGISLFDRVRRRLILTSQGEELLAHCRTVLGAVHSLEEQAQVLRRGDRGVLRVAATPQSIEGVLATFSKAYTERHPNVHIRLMEAVGAHLVSLLETGQVHVTVGIIQTAQVENPFIESRELAPLDFLAVSHKRLAAATARAIDIDSLARYPLLLLDSDFYVRQTFDAACRLAGVKPNVVLTSRAPHTLLALAEAGHGVAIVPSVVHTKRYRVVVARIHHARRPLQGTYAVSWDKRRGVPPYAADFCDSLAAHIRLVSLSSRQGLAATKRSPKERR